MELAEIQGLYGPIWISEERIQLLWGLQYIRRGKWKTLSGKRLRVISVGEWNRGAGPDFLGAILEINEQRVLGDVEIHLYSEDWWSHGHVLDSRYNGVVLHIVLFAGRGLDRVALKENGDHPETFLLGPWMEADIEEASLYGEQDLHWVGAMERVLTEHSGQRIQKQLRELGRKRFEKKVEMAMALSRSGGDEDCYKLGLLYVLGYPSNRGPFFKWGTEQQTTGWLPIGKGKREALLSLLESHWNRHQGRPQGHPRERMRQFWNLEEDRDWVDSLMGQLETWDWGMVDDKVGMETQRFRRMVKMGERIRGLKEILSAGRLSEAVCNRYWVDFLLPYLAAKQGAGAKVFSYWFHWLPAEFPQSYRSYLEKVSSPTERCVVCNGWIQGLYGLRDRLKLSERTRHL